MDRSLSRSLTYLPRYRSSSPTRSSRLGRKVYITRSSSQPRSRLLYSSSSPSPHRAIYSCHVHHSPSPHRSYRQHLITTATSTPVLTRKSQSVSSHDITSSHLYTSQEDLVSGSLRELDVPRRVVSSEDIYHKGPYYPDATQSESGVSMGESDDGSIYGEDDLISQNSFGSSSAYFEATIDSELSDMSHGASSGAAGGWSGHSRRRDLHSPDSNRSSPLSYKEIRKRELMSSPSSDFDKIQSRFQALKVSIPGSGDSMSAKSPRDKRVSASPLAQSTPHVSPRGFGETKLSIKACWNVDEPDDDELGMDGSKAKKSNAVRTLFPLDTSDPDLPLSARAQDSSCNSSFSEDNAADISNITVSSLDRVSRRTKLVKKASDTKQSTAAGNTDKLEFLSRGDTVMQVDAGPEISTSGSVREYSAVSDNSVSDKAGVGDNKISEKETSPAEIVGNEWWAVYNIESANARERKENEKSEIGSGSNSPTGCEPGAVLARNIRVVKPVKVSNIPLISAGKQGQEKLKRRSHTTPTSSPHSSPGSLSPTGVNGKTLTTSLVQNENSMPRSESPESDNLHTSSGQGDIGSEGKSRLGVDEESNRRNENSEEGDGEKKKKKKGEEEEEEEEKEFLLYESRIASGASLVLDKRNEEMTGGNEGNEIEHGNLRPGDYYPTRSENLDSTHGMKNDQHTAWSERGSESQGKQLNTYEETEIGTADLPLPDGLSVNEGTEAEIDKDERFGWVDTEESNIGIDTESFSENDVTVVENIKVWNVEIVDINKLSGQPVGHSSVADGECPVSLPDNYKEEEYVEEGNVIYQSTQGSDSGHYQLPNSSVGRNESEREEEGENVEAGSTTHQVGPGSGPLPEQTALVQVCTSPPPSNNETSDEGTQYTTRDNIEREGLSDSHQFESGERERAADEAQQRDQEKNSDAVSPVTASSRSSSGFSELEEQVELRSSDGKTGAENKILDETSDKNGDHLHAYVSEALLVFRQGQLEKKQQNSLTQNSDIFGTKDGEVNGESQSSISVGEINHDKINTEEIAQTKEDGDIKGSELICEGVSEVTEGFPDDTRNEESLEMERSSIGRVSARHQPGEFPVQQQKRVRVVVATAQKIKDNDSGALNDSQVFNSSDTTISPTHTSTFSPTHSNYHQDDQQFAFLPGTHTHSHQGSAFTPCFSTSVLPDESFDRQAPDVSNQSPHCNNNTIHNSYTSGFDVETPSTELRGSNHFGPQENQVSDFTGKTCGVDRWAGEAARGESIHHHQPRGSEPRHDKGIQRQHESENLKGTRQKHDSGWEESVGEEQFAPLQFVERGENHTVSLPRKQVTSQHVKHTHRTTKTTVETIVRRVNPVGSDFSGFIPNGSDITGGFVDIVTDKHITETIIDEDDDFITTTTTTNTLYPDSGIGDSSFVSTLNTPEDISYDTTLNDSSISTNTCTTTTHHSEQVCNKQPSQSGVGTSGRGIDINGCGFSANSSVHLTPGEKDNRIPSQSRSTNHGDIDQSSVSSHTPRTRYEESDSCCITDVTNASSFSPSTSRLDDADENKTTGDVRSGLGEDNRVTSSLGTHSTEGVFSGSTTTQAPNKAGTVCNDSIMYHNTDSSHVLDTLHAQLSQFSSACDPATLGSTTTTNDVQHTFRSSVNSSVYHDHAEATSVLKQIVRGEFQEYNFSTSPPAGLAKFPTSIPIEIVSDVNEQTSTSTEDSETTVVLEKEHYDNEYDYVTTDLPRNGHSTSRHHIQLLKPGHLKASSLWTLQEETESLLDACSPNASPKRSLSNTATAGAEDENRYSQTIGSTNDPTLTSPRGPQLAKDPWSETGDDNLSLIEAMRQRRARISESPEWEESDGNYSSISTTETSSRRSSSYSRERTPLSDTDSALPSVCEEKMDYQDWAEGVPSNDQISSFNDFVSGLQRPGDMASDEMDTESQRGVHHDGPSSGLDQQPPAPHTFKTSLAFSLSPPENEPNTAGFQALENLSSTLEQFSTTSGFHSVNESFNTSSSSTIEADKQSWAGLPSDGQLNTSGGQSWSDEVTSEASSRLHALDLDLSRISSCASPTPSDFSESSNFTCKGTAEVKRVYNFDYDTVPAITGTPLPQTTSTPKDKPLKSALKRPLPPEEINMTERQRQTFKMFDEILQDFNKKTSPLEAIHEVRFMDDTEPQSSTTTTTTTSSTTAATTTATTTTTTVPGSPPNTNFCDLYKDFTTEESEKKQSHTCIVVEDENMSTFRFKRFLKKSHTRRNKKGRRIMSFLSRLNCVSESVHSPDMNSNRKQLSIPTGDQSQTFSTDSMPSPKFRKISHPVLISSTSFQHHPEFIQDRFKDQDSPFSSPDKSPVKSTPSSSNQSLDSLRSRTDSAYSSISESTSHPITPSHLLSPVTVHGGSDKQDFGFRTMSTDSAFSVTPRSSNRTFSVFSEAMSPNPDLTMTNLNSTADSSKNHNSDMLSALSDVFDQLDVCEGEIDTALLNRLRHGHHQASTGHKL